LFNFCSKIDANYSKIKQFYCSVVKQLDGWMTTKILNSNFNSTLFFPAAGNR